jgi:hypothetical protein
MGSIKAAKTKKGYDELKAVVGSAPPIELNTLSADELKQLTELVASALDRHEAAMVEAEENVVNFAPRLMRGSVRRLLGAGR